MGGKSILTRATLPDPGRAVRPWVATLLATPLTHQMADSPFNRLELEAWSQSLQDAVSTGELYAQRCLSRIRPGAMTKVANTPVRRSPSSTPTPIPPVIFSLQVGWIRALVHFSVGQATGAGGANVWTSAQLRDALSGTDHQQAGCRLEPASLWRSGARFDLQPATGSRSRISAYQGSRTRWPEPI